jgi:hemerythrin-like domain-containing protein
MNRPRITKRVNVQEVVNALEVKRKQYSEAIGHIMLEENVSYSQAKQLFQSRLRDKVLSNF